MTRIMAALWALSKKVPPYKTASSLNINYLNIIFE